MQNGDERVEGRGTKGGGQIAPDADVFAVCSSQFSFFKDWIWGARSRPLAEAHQVPEEEPLISANEHESMRRLIDCTRRW